MTIVGTQVFENGQTDPTFQLNALVSSRAHIIGLFGSGTPVNLFILSFFDPKSLNCFFVCSC
jgi:hypothetical protein